MTSARLPATTWGSQRRVAAHEDEGFVVVVVDRVSGRFEAHGPFTGIDAVLDAERRRQDVESRGAQEILVEVARLARCRRPQGDQS